MNEDNGSDHQDTVGGRELPVDPSDEPLYVGPLDDPDRYELLDDGIRGGEGRTWRASYRGGLNNPLVEAVKMLFPPEGGDATWPNAVDLRRWHDNAALLRHLASPHVVQLHDIFGGVAPHPKGWPGAGRTLAYLTMEWVEGPTLAAKVAGRPLTAATLRERLQYIGDVATAVASLHSHTRSAGNPVLHRDLTPANCIVHATRGIVLIDISGMRLVDDGFDPLGRHTQAYAAPEVLHAPHEPRAPSSDLYAVGAVAVFILTGQDPDADPDHRAALLERVTKLLQEAGVGAAPAAAEHLLALLNPDPGARPNDVLSWNRGLAALAASSSDAGGTVGPGDAADQPPDGGSDPSGRRSLIGRRGFGRRGIFALGTPVVAAAAVGAALLLHHGSTTGHDVTTASRSHSRTQPTPQSTDFRLLPGLASPLDASAGLSTVDFASALGRFTTPARGARVQNCAYFTGTSDLPAGQTIMLSMHDLGIDDNFRWMQVVFGYKRPDTLTTWTGVQFFNEQALGHKVHIELIEMPLNAALIKANHDNNAQALDRLADHGKVIAATTVTRVKGVFSQDACPPPAGTQGD
jgi:serine/threonine protein kinase